MKMVNNCDLKSDQFIDRRPVNRAHTHTRTLTVPTKDLTFAARARGERDIFFFPTIDRRRLCTHTLKNKQTNTQCGGGCGGVGRLRDDDARLYAHENTTNILSNI